MKHVSLYLEQSIHVRQTLNIRCLGGGQVLQESCMGWGAIHFLLRYPSGAQKTVQRLWEDNDEKVLRHEDAVCIQEQCWRSRSDTITP